jgi:hypothetical protein
MSESDEARPSLIPGWADRTAVLVVLILALQAGFIWSYVAALHNPQPKHLPFGVVAPAALFKPLQTQIASKTDAVDVVLVSSRAAALRKVENRTLLGAYVFDATKPADTLLTTGVPSIAIETTFRTLLDQVGATLRAQDPALARPYSVEVVHPFDPGDPDGLSPFYLVVGWVVGGYLLLAFFGFTQREFHGWDGLARRLALLIGYAVASGLIGAVFVGPVLHVFEGHFWAIAALGAALSFAVIAIVQAAELIAGPIYGTGLAIVAFVILGNPSAGGPFPRSFSPGFWARIGAWLPPGMGVDGIRGVVYDYPGLSPALARIAGYIAFGVALCVLMTALERRGSPRPVVAPVTTV